MNKLTPTLCLIATLLITNPAHARRHADLNKKYLKFFNKYHTIYVMNKDHSLQTAVIKSITPSLHNTNKYLEFHIQTDNPNVPVLKIGKNDLKTNPKKMQTLWLHWQHGNRKGHKEHAKVYPYKRGKCLFVSDDHASPFFWLMRKKVTTQITFKEFEKICPSDDLIDVFHPQTKKVSHKRHNSNHSQQTTAIDNKLLQKIMATLEQQKREIASLKRTIANLPAPVTYSSSGNASDDAVAQLQRQINSLKSKINTMSNTVSGDNVYDDRSLKNRISRLESKMGDMRFESSNNSLLDRVKSLESQIRNLSSNSSSSSSNSHDYSSDIYQLKQQLENLNGKIDGGNSGRGLDTEVDRLKSKVSDLERELNSRANSSDMSQMRHKIDSLENKVSNNNSTSDVQSLKYKLDSLESKVNNNNSTSDVQSLKYKVDSIQSKLQTLESNISQLVVKLSSMH